MSSYIGGLASGLDTASMIRQLMEVERNPIRNLQANRQNLVAKDDAWRDVATRLSSLRTSLDSLSSSSDLDGYLTASSSNQDRATATVTGNALPQTLTFTVDQLASRHEVISTGGFASADSLVGAGTFTIDIGGVSHDVTTNADTTLSQLAASINDLGVGVSASVFSVDGSTAELRLVSDETGATSAFTASGDQAGFSSIDAIRAGQDAQLTMGALTITRSSNLIADLVPGVTVDLRSTGPDEVSITVARDVAGIVEAVGDVVKDLNSAINRLKQLTAYNAESGTGGILLGDSTARQILNDLQSSINTLTLAEGPFRHAGAIGIEIQRDGTISFDEGKLGAAIQEDYQGVSRLLSRWGSTSDLGLEFIRSGSNTVDGSYEVVITQAARAATVTGSVFTSPGGDIEFEITSGSATADVTIAAGSDLTGAIAAINSALVTAGLNAISAVEDGGAIRLNDSRFGSARSFTVAGSGALGLDGTQFGTDVAGTIGGEAAAGSGRSLTGTSGAVGGLIVSVLVDQGAVDGAGGALALGTVVATGGLMGAISRAVAAAEGADGAISRAQDLWKARIDMVDNQIDRLEDRLVTVEDQLIRQFTAMEQALAQLYSQQAWMQSQLAGLQTQG